MCGVAHEIRMTGRLDPRDGWEADRCTVAATLDVLSTRSALLILREAFYGAHRFDQFVARVGISEPVAAARLRELVDHGLLARRRYRDPGQRARSGYELTQKGAELLPVLVAMMQWGDRWATDDGGAVRLVHRECGEPVRAALRCAAGHDVGGDELDLVERTRRRERSVT